jgi:uncharacterized protein with LGFP repeats
MHHIILPCRSDTQWQYFCGAGVASVNDETQVVITRRPLLIALAALSSQVSALPRVAFAEAAGNLPVPPVRLDTVALNALASRSADLVRTLHSDAPFSLVGLRWSGAAPDSAQVRVRHRDSWGPWIDLDPVDVPLGSGAGRGGASELAWTGESQDAQVRTLRGGAPARDVAAVLVHPGQTSSDFGPPKPRASTYQVISRAAWGADESLRCQAPQYSDSVRALALHHTAETNNYTREQSAGIVRAIYTYHARTLGWCDIGYHALVDRYGQIFEGRAGGLTRPVIGAHAGGFNQRTSGIAMIGTYTDAPPPEAEFWALAAYVNWKLGVHRLDPRGQTTLVSQGGSATRHAKGAAVTVPVLFGHRDVCTTACPGNAGYALLPRLRDIAARAPSPA